MATASGARTRRAPRVGLVARHAHAAALAPARNPLPGPGGKRWTGGAGAARRGGHTMASPVATSEWAFTQLLPNADPGTARARIAHYSATPEAVADALGRADLPETVPPLGYASARRICACPTRRRSAAQEPQRHAAPAHQRPVRAAQRRRRAQAAPVSPGRSSRTPSGWSARAVHGRRPRRARGAAAGQRAPADPAAQLYQWCARQRRAGARRDGRGACSNRPQRRGEPGDRRPVPDDPVSAGERAARQPAKRAEEEPLKEAVRRIYAGSGRDTEDP